MGPSLVSAAASRLPAPALVGRSISRASFSAVRAGSGNGAGSTSANTPSRASTNPARARRVRWATEEITAVRYNRQPEWMATTPPVSGWCDTRRKEAARIMSANAAGFGNLRIDSTR